MLSTLSAPDPPASPSVRAVRDEIAALAPLEQLELIAGALELATAATERLATHHEASYQPLAATLAHPLADAARRVGATPDGLQRAQRLLDEPDEIDHAAGALEQAAAGLVHLAQAGLAGDPLDTRRLTRTASSASELAAALRAHYNSHQEAA